MNIEEKVSKYINESWNDQEVKRAFERFTKKINDKVESLKKRDIKGDKPFKGFNAKSMEKKWTSLNNDLYNFLSKYFN